MRTAITFLIFSIATSSFSQLTPEWMGHYKGELTSLNLEGKESNFGMELLINEINDSTYDFTIIYTGEGIKQERAYQIYTDGPGHYMLDEKNGIVVDMSFGKDRLVSFFEVQGNFIHVSYILEKKGIRFELTSSIAADKTGGILNDGTEIPEVQSYKTVSFQYASLKRQK